MKMRDNRARIADLIREERTRVEGRRISARVARRK